MATPQRQLRQFRQLWMSRRTLNRDTVDKLEHEFWRLAGCPEGKRFPVGPPSLPGLLDLVTEILQKYVKRTPDEEADSLRNSLNSYTLKEITEIALFGGRVSEDFFRQIVEMNAHYWNYFRVTIERPILKYT